MQSASKLGCSMKLANARLQVGTDEVGELLEEGALSGLHKVSSIARIVGV